MFSESDANRASEKSSGAPGWDSPHHVPHHLIEGGVDFVGGLGSSIGEGGPAHAGCGAHHDGGGTRQATVVPPISGAVVADHPAASVACMGLVDRRAQV